MSDLLPGPRLSVAMDEWFRSSVVCPCGVGWVCGGCVVLVVVGPAMGWEHRPWSPGTKCLIDSGLFPSFPAISFRLISPSVLGDQPSVPRGPRVGVSDPHGPTRAALAGRAPHGRPLPRSESIIQSGARRPSSAVSVGSSGAVSGSGESGVISVRNHRRRHDSRCTHSSGGLHVGCATQSSTPDHPVPGSVARTTAASHPATLRPGDPTPLVQTVTDGGLVCRSLCQPVLTVTDRCTESAPFGRGTHCRESASRGFRCSI